jgi:hypothetical protein
MTQMDYAEIIPAGGAAGWRALRRQSLVETADYASLIRPTCFYDSPTGHRQLTGPYRSADQRHDFIEKPTDFPPKRSLPSIFLLVDGQQSWSFRDLAAWSHDVKLPDDVHLCPISVELQH